VGGRTTIASSGAFTTGTRDPAITGSLGIAEVKQRLGSAGVRVRHAAPTEAEAVRALGVREAAVDGFVLVAEDADGHVVGAVAAAPTGELDLRVGPETRSRGHGSMLLACALEELAERGSATASVAVEAGDVHATRFLEERGFEAVSTDRFERSVEGFRRRWDTDARGTGVADGSALVPALDALGAALREPGWVAEQPELHLLPHVRSLADDLGWEVRRADVVDGVLELEIGVPGGERRQLRTAAYAVLGTFAEPTTLIRQHEREHEGLTLTAATGVLDGESAFAPHGHTVRIRATAT
jgi:ribosomal protein S18 acetylase RimI-like enzyme